MPRSVSLRTAREGVRSSAKGCAPVNNQCTDAVRVVRGRGECDIAAPSNVPSRGAAECRHGRERRRYRPPASGPIGSRIVRLSAAAMATAVYKDQAPPTPEELFDIAGLTPGFEAFGHAVQQHKRLAGTQVLISDRDAVFGNSLGRARVGKSIDQ